MKYLLFFLFPCIVISQNFDCDPLCDNPVSTIHNFLIEYAPDCEFNVTLEEKLCSNGKTLITLLNVSGFNFLSCGSPDAGILVLQTMHAIIRDNPLGLSNGNYKYLYKSCWRYIDPPFNSMIEPCTIQCCSFEITYTDNCNRVLPTKIIKSYIQDCITPTGSLPPGCSNACGDFYEDGFFIREYNETN